MKLSDFLPLAPSYKVVVTGIVFRRMSVLFVIMCLWLHQQSLAYANTPRQNSEITINSLEQAIARAIEVDPWLSGNRLRQQSVLARSKSVQTLPDPKLSVSVLNLPTDGFSFSQEPMTQIKLGVSQSFPRGDSQLIKQRHLHKLAAQYPYLAQDRIAKTAVTVSLLWIEAIKAQQGIDYIESQTLVFKQLVDTVQSQYASGRINTRQDDVVRAQLELSRILDRQSLLMSERDQALAELTELLSDSLVGVKLSIPSALPQISMDWVERTADSSHVTRQQDIEILQGHPAFLSIEQRLKAASEQVKLVEQKRKPQWALNASYAQRQDASNGDSRADFFSVGVSVDMPLFTSNYIDSDVRAEQLASEALKTEQRLLVRKMLSELNRLRSQFRQNKDRLQLYQETLLPQLQEQSQASLTAYTNGESEFKQVVTARKAQFNGELDMINVAALQHSLSGQASYYLPNRFKTTLEDNNNE